MWSRNVHDTKNAHNLCNNCHMTGHTHIPRRHCWYRYDCILTRPASGYKSTSGVHDVPRSTPSTPLWNTINTMMETRFIGGARINKESRPEINSAAGEASIQLLQLIPCCHGGHSLLWCKFGLVLVEMRLMHWPLWSQFFKAVVWYKYSISNLK